MSYYAFSVGADGAKPEPIKIQAVIDLPDPKYKDPVKRCIKATLFKLMKYNLELNYVPGAQLHVAKRLSQLSIATAFDPVLRSLSRIIIDG